MKATKLTTKNSRNALRCGSAAVRAVPRPPSTTRAGTPKSNRNTRTEIVISNKRRNDQTGIAPETPNSFLLKYATRLTYTTWRDLYTKRQKRVQVAQYNATSAFPTLASQAATLSLDGVSSDPCLLYTSPSPRDRTRSRMPSSA